MEASLQPSGSGSPGNVRAVVLGGVRTLLEGAADDPYFEAVEHHAAGLDGLAALVARHVPPSSTVIDVGANIGLSTILLARLARHVVAYEPSPPNVALLRRNLALNGITNVEVRAAAASSRPGALRFHVAQFGAGSHVVASGHVSGGTTETVGVPAVTLDGETLPSIAFIKIDAEGHEPDVLAGARRLLARDRPLIYAEMNLWCLSAFAGHSPGALVRTLWQAFEVGKPEADGQVSPLWDAYGFLHDLIVHNGGMADIVLRPREGADMPTLPELAWPEPAVALARRAARRPGAIAARGVADLRERLGRGADLAMLDYALAFAAGLIAVMALLPLPAVLGTGAIWASPPGDVARSLTGHLAFQEDPWRWPLLTTGMMLWPHGASVAMADGNPVMSVLAKGVTRLFGLAPVNLLGAWLALCFLLQPVAAVFALRGVTRGRPEASLAVAALSVLSLAWLARVVHINLMGHFVILAALGLTLRMLGDGVRRGWAKAAVVLTAAVLFHPYLYLMSAAVLAAVPAEATLLRRRSAGRHWIGLALACAVPFALFRLLNGAFEGGGVGFGFFSMNLLSPVWPQVSGLFGPNLPMIDATGGQTEGFNYLGAGLLFLLAAAGVSLAAERRLPRLHPGLLLSLAGLTVLALSSHVYAGRWLLLDFGEQPWSRVFAPIRASGRMFWPVGYALLIGGVAAVSAARLPRWAVMATLAAAVLLQGIDAGPMLGRTASQIAGRYYVQGASVQVPPGTTLVSPAPSIMCTTDPVPIEIATALLLHGARDGMRLGDAGLARAPPGFGCDKAWLDAMEAPLAVGEARVFTLAATAPELRLARFGAGARCGQVGAVTVCSRGPVPPAGTPITAMGQVARLPAVASGLAGTALLPVLASGWALDAEGVPLSSGRLATLLFALDGLPPGRGVHVTLHFHPIRPSGVPRLRTVLLRADMRDVARVEARDDEPAVASVEFTAEEAAAGVFRVALDLAPDTDSLKPSRPVPVRLTSINVAPGCRSC